MPIIDKSIMSDLTGEHANGLRYNDMIAADIYENSTEIVLRKEINATKEDLANSIKVNNIKISKIFEQFEDKLKNTNNDISYLLNAKKQKEEEQKEHEKYIKNLSAWKRFKLIWKFIFKGELYF